MSQNTHNPETDTTIVGGQSNGYIPQSQQQHQQFQSQNPNGNKSLLMGILIGVAVMLIGILAFVLYNNYRNKSAENERLIQQHIEDSLKTELAKNAAKEKAAQEAQATAEAQAAEASAAKAAAEASKYATASGTYTGRIAKSKYTMYLTQNGSELSGRDRWNNYSSYCDLYGSIYGNSVTLEEYSEGEQTGYISGTISGKYFKGTFTNYKGNSYSFTLVR